MYSTFWRYQLEITPGGPTVSDFRLRHPSGETQVSAPGTIATSGRIALYTYSFLADSTATIDYDNVIIRERP